MAGQDFSYRLLFGDGDGKDGVLADLRGREGEFVERAAKGIGFKPLFAVPASQTGLKAALDAREPDVFIKANTVAPVSFDLLGRDGTREAENVPQDIAVGIFAPGTGAHGDSGQVLSALLDGERGFPGHGASQAGWCVRCQPRLAEFEAQIFEALARQHGQVGQYGAFALRGKIRRS